MKTMFSNQVVLDRINIKLQMMMTAGEMQMIYRLKKIRIRKNCKMLWMKFSSLNKILKRWS